ncbi:RimK family alpha-L-glutamate ligase [Betaproteobacteria bacterium]|nr:RimK family alpha-L-glutamate ligase [Betaproteobacteria bacterium]
MDRVGKVSNEKKREVIIFSDEIGWHTDQLQIGLNRSGITSRILNLSSVDIFIDCAKDKFVLRNFKTNPSCCFVRGIEGGTLEQVTRRLAILHQLESLGVPIVNSGKGIENSVDKCMTSFLLRMQDISTPDCWALEDKATSIKLINRLLDEGRNLVIKPIFGSQGINVTLIDEKIKNEKNFEKKINFAKGVYYIQEFVEPMGSLLRDFRVFVVDDEVIAAMERKGQGWVHNVAKGGVCRRIIPDNFLKKLAIQSIRAVGLEIGGVDIIEDKSSEIGYKVLEVNGVPAWKGLQNVSDINISDKIIKFMISKLR